MPEEVIHDNPKLPNSTRNIIFGLLGVIVLAILFRHTAIVRYTALFIFSVPLVIIGWLIGKLLRDFVMPDYIITTGGFGGLLKARLFWMMGPQAIGACVGFFIAAEIAGTLFTPPIPPLSTVEQVAQFDGDSPLQVIKNSDVHQKILNAGMLPYNLSDPEQFYDLLKNDLKSGEPVQTEEVGIGNVTSPYLALSGCETADCKSHNGAFVVIYGDDPDDIAYIAISTTSGIQELPAPFEETFGSKLVPNDAVAQFQAWKAKVAPPPSTPAASDSSSSANQAPPSIPDHPFLSAPTQPSPSNNEANLSHGNNLASSNPPSATTGDLGSVPVAPVTASPTYTLPPASAAAPPHQSVIPQGYSVSEDYSGSYACSQSTNFDLKVLTNPNNSTVQYAIFSFGPPGTNVKNAPLGSYLMSGSFDKFNGSLAFQPVSWIKQPFGYTMVGLSGTSGDGGTTFAGQINFTGCGSFQLTNDNRAAPPSASNTSPPPNVVASAATPPAQPSSVQPASPAASPSAPALAATYLYTKTVYDCHSIDLNGWQHPVRNVLEGAAATIDKVELCNDSVYPVFTVKLPSGHPFSASSPYYSELLENVAAANGWWSYALVDKTTDLAITVTITKKHQIVVSTESFSGSR